MAKEEKLGAADQRQLYAKASIADITTKMENGWQENVMKLALAHRVRTKNVHPLITRIGSSPRNWRDGCPD
jgi:hypothetical protein